MASDPSLHRAANEALRARKFDEALKRYSELAASGSPNAWINLGWMYQHGAGVPKNLAEAERCYSKAATFDYPSANFYLARLLVARKDYKSAFAAFSAAAAKGDLPSLYWLGTLYLEGEGIDRDVEKAGGYLKQAADRGHIFARRDYHLGLLRGTFGEKELLPGFKGWVLALLAAVRVAIRDPRSKLMQ